MIWTALFTLAAMLAAQVASAEPWPCLAPKPAGACFSIRGKLIQTNGTPNIRILRIGTNRILGVVDDVGNSESDFVMPRRVSKLLKANGAVYGNFEVCPLTKERPGWMQTVCIVQATELFAQKSN